MGAANEPKNYVVGKGRLFFDAFKPGTKTPIGERYFGNTPELSNSTSTDKLDHFDADKGLKVKDESIAISNELSGSFITDNINSANVAMFFSGGIEKAVVVAGTALVDPDQEVVRGLSYQLGTSAVMPSGTRNVTNVKVSTVVPGVLPADPPVVTLLATLPGNVDIDLARARVYIEVDAPDIPVGSVLRFTYDQVAGTRETVIGKADVVSGALRFLSENPVGLQRDYYWPYVKITPNGDYALKSDDWQQVGFSFEVLKRDGATERVYIDGNPI